MATGQISTLSPLSLSGLSARTTNHAAQCYVMDETARRDVGYVTKARRLSLWLWNGSDSDIALTGISANEASEGIGWDASPPDAIISKGSLRINLTITVDGPLEFEALLSFITGCTFTPALTIIGTRAPQLSTEIAYLLFQHNWENGLDESLAWMTDVLIANDRTEQRIQLRTMPRRSFDLRYLVAGDGRRKLESWLGLRKTRQICTPVWRDLGRTTGSIVVDSSVVPVETAHLDYAIGRPVAVFDAWDHYELRTITGIGPGYVAVEPPFNRYWPEGSMVAPCRFGFCLQQRRVARFTEEVAEYQLTMEVSGESLMPAMATPDTYRSVAVCPITPSWESPELAMDNKWVRLDNETGVLEYDIQSIEPVLSRSATFLVIGRARIDEMLRFLFSLAGRLAPFWLATDDRAFELAAPAAQDATILVIHPIDYDFALSGSPAREHVEMITTDGTVIRRKITAIATLPSGLEQWTIDSGLPVAIDAATLNRCAWLELVRLENDTVNLHWVAWDCLALTLSVVALP